MYFLTTEALTPTAVKCGRLFLVVYVCQGFKTFDESLGSTHPFLFNGLSIAVVSVNEINGEVACELYSCKTLRKRQ